MPSPTLNLMTFVTTGILQNDMCDLRGLIIKDYVASPLVCSRSLALGEAKYHVMRRSVEKPMWQETTFLPTAMCMNDLRSSSLSQAFRWLQPSWKILTATLWKILSHNHSSKLLPNSWVKEIMRQYMSIILSCFIQRQFVQINRTLPKHFFLPYAFLFPVIDKTIHYVIQTTECWCHQFIPLHPLYPSFSFCLISLYYGALYSIPLSITLPSSCLLTFFPGLYQEINYFYNISVNWIFKHSHQVILFKIRPSSGTSYSLLVCSLICYHDLLNLISQTPNCFMLLKLFL